MILTALKKYGMFVADIGTSGTSAARRTRAGATAISTGFNVVSMGDFECVDMGVPLQH